MARVLMLYLLCSPLSALQYGSVMILILVAEIAVGVTAYAMKDTARAETKKFLSSTIKDYYATPDHSDAVTLLWNSIMMEVSYLLGHVYSEK